MKRMKLVPKNIAKDANEERLRMLEEDEEDDVEAECSMDRFRESRRSRHSCFTSRSRNNSLSE